MVPSAPGAAARTVIPEATPGRSYHPGMDARPRPAPAPTCPPERSRFAVFDECPQCGGAMAPEHAHFRCGACGWRDSCCD